MLRTGEAASRGVVDSGRGWERSRQSSMTADDQKRPRCYGYSKESGQTVLMSTNLFGSPDLDQRATLACAVFGFRRRKGSPGPPLLATLPILAVLVRSCFAASTGHAGCPDLY